MSVALGFNARTVKYVYVITPRDGCNFEPFTIKDESIADAARKAAQQISGSKKIELERITGVIPGLGVFQAVRRDNTKAKRCYVALTGKFHVGVANA